MSGLPKTKKSIVLRTDFTNDGVWENVCSDISTPAGNHRVSVEFVNDTQFDCLTIDQLLELIPPSSKKTFIFLVDEKTISDPDHPVLTVDLFQDKGRTFRVTPSQTAAVENNLAIANMDWEDFALNTDKDGIFRNLPY
ncbi:MAG: hypothetical protein F6K30_11930 [Cyanothece sp. SIO2G6]|nr:hypothetical protein [Cyanothece sp. SIO2G6]